MEDLGGCVNGPGLGMSPLPSHLNVQGLSCGLGGGGLTFRGDFGVTKALGPVSRQGLSMTYQVS